MSQVILIDTSAFHALQNKGDLQEHASALTIAEDLEEENKVLVTSDYILDETYTLLRSVLGHHTAVSFGREIRKGGIEIVQVDESIQKDAWIIFEEYKDKDFSFTDCTSFVIMKRAKILLAFTFDRHFQQYGFQTLPAKLPLKRK